MPALAPFIVTRTARNIPGLVAGKTYIIQYRFSRSRVRYVEYCNHATDPTGENLSWFSLKPGAFITTGTYSATDPLWLRCPDDPGDPENANTARVSVAEQA